MAEEDAASEKHLGVELRRKRFDPKSRYGGRGGATLVKVRPATDISIDGYSRINLDVERPRDEEGHILVSKLDQDIPGLCSGDELPVSLSVQLPELFGKICVAKKTDRGKDQVVVTTYTVEGVAWMAPSEDERLQMEQRRAARLTLLTEKGDESRMRPFVKLRDMPLEKIVDRSLLDAHSRLLAKNCVSGGSQVQRARVFDEHVMHVFEASSEKDTLSYLEVDLGANCDVTYISTQGRFPPISFTDTASGCRVVQDGSSAFNNWVSSYELSCRVASGKDWVIMGEFKGNTDMTTEVAHEVARGQKAINCRYLRFRPLTYNRAPAMRVGVYGRRLGDEVALHEKGMESGNNLIRYSIHRIKENINTRRVPVGAAQCRYGCAKCSKYRGVCKTDDQCAPKARRMRLRAGTVQEVRLLASSAPLAAVAEHEASDGDDGEPRGEEKEDAEEEVAVPPPPPPQPRRLARQRSRSDPDLASSAASSVGSTLGDSVELVAEPNIEHFEDDDWVFTG